MGKLNTKIVSIITLLFFAVSFLGSTIPVGAVPDKGGEPTGKGEFDKLTIGDRAQVWALIAGAAYCADRLIPGQEISTSKITSGELFGNDAIAVGHIVDPDDGRLSCNNENSWLSSFLDEMGYSGNYTELAKQIYEGRDTDADGKIDKYFITDTSAFAFKLRLATYWFNSSNLPTQAPPETAYNILFRHFTGICGGELIATPDAVASADNAVDIWVYDEDADKVKQVKYSYSDPNQLISIGYGLPADGGNDGKMACKTIAENLGNRTYADSMALLVKDKGDSVLKNPDDRSTETGDSCLADIPVLGWLICAVAEIADGFIGWIEKELKALLTISPSEYNDGGLKTAWGSMRIVATVLLIAVALFMVISQMLSSDLVSAYTIKKVIPKLVIATILIQLSWFMFTSLILITNVVGNGIADLIYAPFGGAYQVGDITSILNRYYETAGGERTAAANTIILGAVGVFGVAAIGGGVGLLFAALGVLVSVMIGFVVLVLRKVTLIFLLILSPLALVAWILPNTQRWWSTWWSTFSKLLIMFPMIMGLLAVGKVFAYVVAGAPITSSSAVNNTSQTLAVLQPLQHFAIAEGVTSQVRFFIILIAYFGPFALIPTTFAIAGGIFAKATGAVTGFGKKQSAGAKGAFEQKSKDWAGSHYKPGSRGRNTLIRAATGSPTILGGKYGRSGAAKMASGAKQYEDKKEQEASFLMQQTLASLKNDYDEDGNITKLGYTKQSEYLEKMGMTGDISQAKAAVKQLMARTDYAQVENIARADPQRFDEMKTDSDIAKTLAGSRTDLLKSNSSWASNLNSEKLSNQDKSLHIKLRQGEKDKNGDVVRNASGQTFLEETLAGDHRETFLSTVRTLANDPIRLGKLSPEDQEMYRQLATTGTYSPPGGGSSKNIGTVPINGGATPPAATPPASGSGPGPSVPPRGTV